ncbi:MAG: pyrroline-5-carboxylate reductase [Chloroflexota bacterium]
MKIAFIGAGTMGEAMIRGLIRKKVCAPGDITIYDVKQARLDAVTKKHKVKAAGAAERAIAGADIIIIAVKPQDIKGLLSELKDEISRRALVLSIAAGVTLDTLTQGLRHRAVVRAMPNMPAQIGEGMTVWTATPEVTREQKEAVSKLLGALGEELYVAGEDYVDMATALSGSGPAFIFLMIEALTDAGVHIGLPRAASEKLTLQTIIGSADAVKKTGRHPAELKNLVTSPGGTTTEGLKQLEGGGIRHLLLQAVTAAYEKAKHLGKR